MRLELCDIDDLMCIFAIIDTGKANMSDLNKKKALKSLRMASKEDRNEINKNANLNIISPSSTDTQQIFVKYATLSHV